MRVTSSLCLLLKLSWHHASTLKSLQKICFHLLLAHHVFLPFREWMTGKALGVIVNGWLCSKIESFISYSYSFLTLGHILAVKSKNYVVT